MATDTATRNITENEWTQFKPAILRVLQMKSKKTLSETMMKEHNFIATAAQYEHRLNKWKIRSYLTVFEWKVILPIVDRLKARSMLSRILLSGVVLNDGRISRGRKQCNNDQRQPLSRQESRYSPLDQVAIEIQRSDGSWTPLSPSDGDSFYIFRQARGKRNSIQKHVTRTRELAFTGPVESRSEHPVPRRVQHCDFVERTTIIPQISSSPPGRYSVVAFSPSASLTLHDEISEEWMDQSCSFQAEDISIVSESFRQCEPWKVGSNQFGSLQTASHVFNTSFDPSRLCECMFPDLSNPFQLSVFNNRRYGWMEDIRRQALVLLRLSQKDVDSEIMSLDGITSANVMNFIIFSVANGFSELNEIPDQDISNYIQKPDHLEFLSRHLESCSSHVRKSLVNNLLKSAIGAEDVRAVKRLLDFGLIRPDDIIGGFGTPKSHYAVHCAIHLHNQQLLEVFVQAGAKCDDCCMHLLLRRTLSRLKPHLTPPMGPMSVSPMSPEITAQIAGLIIQAGATVSIGDINLAFEYHFTSLARVLIDKLDPLDSTKLLSERTLRWAVLKSDETTALELVVKFVESQFVDCAEGPHRDTSGSTHSARPSYDFSDDFSDEFSDDSSDGYASDGYISDDYISGDYISGDYISGDYISGDYISGDFEDNFYDEFGDDLIDMIGGPGEPNEETALLIEAANHQYLQIIEVFKAPTVMDRLNVHWGQVLSAVIRAQNRGLTSMILSMNPDLFEEPHSIDFPLPIGPIKAEEWGLHKTSVNRRHGNRRNRVRRQIEIKRFKFKQTTTYAEAIRATHNEVVDQIERSSDYQSALSVGQALQCAIDASAAVGNRQMLCKLLRIEPTGIGLDLKKTMTHAILNGHDEEFWLLFQKGANLNPTRQRTSAGRRLSHYPHPLLAALLKQNEHIFFGLLAAGPFRLTDDLCYLSYEPYNHEKTCLLDQAILWGNEKIIHALPTFLSTCVREPKSPSFAGVQCSFSDRVIEALRANDGRVLDLLVMKKLFGTKSLTSLFYLVTPLDDVVFLRRLIAHGADPFPQLGEAFRKMQYRDEIWDRIRHIFKPPWLDLFWVLLDLARESPHASHVGTLILRRALLLGEVGLQHTQRLLELDSVHHPGRSMPLPWSISVKWLMKSKTHFGLFRKLADRGFLQDKAEHCLSIAIALRDQELILFVLKHPNITHRLSPWHVGSPLRLAAETGSIEITKLLLAHGAVVDQDGNHGLVILESAIKSRNLELVRYIVGLGVSVNGLMVHHRDFDSPDSFRQHIDGIISPLQVAIITGTPDIIEFLLANGADINEEPFHASRTPLQQAVQLNRPGIVELLMAKGANVNGKAAYNSGATAFQLAVINGNCEIAAFLIKHGADIHAEPAKVNGRRPLEGAAENGRIYMIDFLYQNEYRFEQAECLRAIELAGRNGHWGCVDRISEFMRSTTELENQIDVVFTRYSALERAGKLLGGLELG